MEKPLFIWLKVAKHNSFLVIAIIILMVFLYPFWLGLPFYYISGALPLAAPILFPFFSALLFSAGFIFINLLAAKAMDDKKGQRSVYQWTFYFQFWTISISYFLLFIGYCIVWFSVNFSI
ncbi:hypothetical protein ERJ70_16200 [Sediminibacillus dalangtanensis]|uniref:Uncharacterized protein n=1 Tax=Sediminibacillus dalangtanensis TaxID=2729421 RepID=A0ABX7VYJ8_9BACI|nr:hypothetical protein [Sediminibacillus dalangtanensis]QTN00694.1 hypothetical protein ERJ70_16200 [Sediminibacillus dalangtanensis]